HIDTPPPPPYPLSLHDALPIYGPPVTAVVPGPGENSRPHRGKPLPYRPGHRLGRMFHKDETGDLILFHRPPVNGPHLTGGKHRAHYCSPSRITWATA